MSVRKLTSINITMKAKLIVAQVATANVVPPMLRPKNPQESENQKDKVMKSSDMSSEVPIKVQLTKDQLKELFDKIDLSGINDWSKEDQEEVWKLIKDFDFLFALNDLDLGKASIVQHTIKLTDHTPFKERYHSITPHQFEEIRKHLQEKLEIGTIQCSNSPWASVVVLVRKKDGSLRFCVDLRKLNSHTAKDAYSLPRITENLDCLN